MEHEGYGDTNRVYYSFDNPQRIGERAGRLGNKRTNREIIQTIDRPEN